MYLQFSGTLHFVLHNVCRTIWKTAPSTGAMFSQGLNVAKFWSDVIYQPPSILLGQRSSVCLWAVEKFAAGGGKKCGTFWLCEHWLPGKININLTFESSSSPQPHCAAVSLDSFCSCCCSLTWPSFSAAIFAAFSSSLSLGKNAKQKKTKKPQVKISELPSHTNETNKQKKKKRQKWVWIDVATS